MAKEQEITVELLLQNSKPEKLIQELSFESAMQLLEQMVVAVERGQLPLEAAIQSYERGALLVARLREVLSAAETRLKTLKQDKDGKILES